MTEITDKQTEAHLNDKISPNTSEGASGSDTVAGGVVEKFLGVSGEVRNSESADKAMSLREGLKTYPMCILWSVVLSSGLIMEGYDTALLGSLYALPSFCERFGALNHAGTTYEIPARWQTGLSSGVSVGEIFGLQIGGWAADLFGCRWTLIVCLALLMALNFMFVFAKNLTTILVGQILCGMPWGCFQSLTTTYASELCPVVLRYYLTSFVNLCWVFGQLIASGVLKSSQDHFANENKGWIMPFAIQWIWPVIIGLGIFLAPESPWSLVKRQKFDAAYKSARRLLSGITEEQKGDAAKQMVTRMRLTAEKEKEIEKVATYRECFNRQNWRRTRISCITYIIQNESGTAITGYSTYFFEKAGLSTSLSFTFTIIQYCIAVIGSLTSWFLCMKLGRSTLYIAGVGLQLIFMLVIAIIAFVAQNGWASGGLLLAFYMVYNCTLGPACYCIVPEIPSVKLRVKTVVLARICYNIFGIIFNCVLTPYMLNSTQWNWGAKTALFWACFDVIWLLWCWFELPETKGRTFAEIDELFERHIPARKFKSTVIEPFRDEDLVGRIGKGRMEELVNEEEFNGGTGDVEKALSNDSA